MAFSADISALVISGDPISRSYTFECRNGYMADNGDPWVAVPLLEGGWNISIVDGNPVIGIGKFGVALCDYTYLNEFDPANPVQCFSACRLKCSVHAPTGLEEEYIFRGTMQTPQRGDTSATIEARDPLNKMQNSQVAIDLTSDLNGPNTDVTLDHADNWDDPGDLNTYEIERASPANDWAFSGGVATPTAARRAWFPIVFVVEIQAGGAGPWVEVAASEYMVDAAYGLIRFHSPQAAIDKFRLQEVTVYIEGTLELADAVEEMLTYPWECPDLGCGFTVDSASPTDMLSTDLTGTIAFNPGGKLVAGAGTAFLTELSKGDRIHLKAQPGEPYGIVAFVTDDTNLDLLYNYGGVVAGAGTAYKSTLREAGVNISQLKWAQCEGNAADFYRVLQENYADSKGYKLWYDPMTDQIRGDRVVIDYANQIELGPIVTLPLAATTEDFASAVLVKGQVGKADNLITKAAAVVTDDLVGTDPDGHGNAWTVGPATAPPVPFTFGGVNYGALAYLNDANLDNAYALYYDYPNNPANLVGQTTYYQFLTIDLGAAYNLSTITLYTIPQKTGKEPNSKAAVSIYYSNDGMSYTICTPETYKAELEHDSPNEFDVEGLVMARYLRIWIRPYIWVDDGKELTIGFREIYVFGSQTTCTSACIQGTVAPDVVALTDNVTFTAGGPPWVLAGDPASIFLAELAQGDMVAVSGDLSNWAEVYSVPNNTTAYLYDRYPGIQGATGPGRKAAFVEGNGGHFIGGSGIMHDFIVDYHPDLVTKLTNIGHQTKRDDENLVFSQFQSLDRAYILLQEYIRLYRTITFMTHFDPRIMIFDTVHIQDDHRVGAPDELYFLVQAIEISDGSTRIAGTEYGAGVLR